MTPAKTRAARELAGLTQTEAAGLIERPRGWWARKEMGGRGSEWDPPLWRLWLHLAGIERIPFRRRG